MSTERMESMSLEDLNLNEGTQYSLKNGQKYIVRLARVSDAKDMIEYLSLIAAESDNLTFGPGELVVTLEQEEKFIENTHNNSNQYFVVAEYEGKIIGNLNFSAGTKPRVAHTGDFGVSVAKEYWGNGIAFHLISGLLSWAEESGVIKKIDLKVREDNVKAITLYKNLGFEIEGTIRRSFLIKGEYHNTTYMGKLLD